MCDDVTFWSFLERMFTGKRGFNAGGKGVGNASVASIYTHRVLRRYAFG